MAENDLFGKLKEPTPGAAGAPDVDWFKNGPPPLIQKPHSTDFSAGIFGPPPTEDPIRIEPGRFHDSAQKPAVAPERPLAPNGGPRDRLAEPPKPAEAKPEHIATVENGTLKLAFGDKNFDAALARHDYSKIDLQVPPNITVSHFVNKDGYFFWFKDKNDLQKADVATHYYPMSAQTMCVNGNEPLNLERQRLDSNNALAQLGVRQDQAKGPGAIGSGTPYFDNIDHTTARSPRSVVQFARALSQASPAILEAEENTLKASANAYPNNPYFKLYLADVYTAQAMRPMAEQVKAGRAVPVENAQIVPRLDLALETLRGVVHDSEINLRNRGVKEYGNVKYDMAPNAVFDYPSPMNQQNFFLGGYDQAYQRKQTVEVLRNMTTSGSLFNELKKVIPH